MHHGGVWRSSRLAYGCERCRPLPSLSGACAHAHTPTSSAWNSLALCAVSKYGAGIALKCCRTTVLGAAVLHSMQAYELLCLDMPAEQAVLAAAAPPGLLDAARAVWAKAVPRASFSSSHCVFAALSWVLQTCQLPMELTCTGCKVIEQPSFHTMGPKKRLLTFVSTS